MRACIVIPAMARGSAAVTSKSGLWSTHARSESADCPTPSMTVTPCPGPLLFTGVMSVQTKTRSFGSLLKMRFNSPASFSLLDQPAGSVRRRPGSTVPDPSVYEPAEKEHGASSEQPTGSTSPAPTELCEGVGEGDSAPTDAVPQAVVIATSTAAPANATPRIIPLERL